MSEAAQVEQPTAEDRFIDAKADAEAYRAKRGEVPTQTRQPFDFDDELRGKIEAMGLQDTVRSLKEEGYGYIHEAADMAFNARLRDVVKRLSQDGMVTDQGSGANMMLDKDPLIVEAVLNPKVLAIVEVMCGKGALITQVASSVRPQGDGEGPGLGLHADQNWTPAPFPVHNQVVTFCWAMDDFNEANGSTKVVPKSHLLARHPTHEEVAAQAGAIATECPAGSVVVWGGALWHGNYPRTSPGERVVLHVSYSRLALRPIERYEHLDEAWLADKPYEMRVLLGREDFLDTAEGAYGGGAERLMRTFTWAKT